MSKFSSFGSCEPVFFVWLSALFIISSFCPAEGTPNTVTSYSSVPAPPVDEDSTENEVYWSILYVVKTGEIGMVVPTGWLQERPELPEYAVGPFESTWGEMFKRWGLSFHDIHSDNYGPEWDKVDHTTLIENYVFDTELGRMRERTLNDAKIVEHVGIRYDPRTGEIVSFLADENLSQLLGYGIVGAEWIGYGFHLLDGYPEGVRDELTDTSSTDQFLKYIYDLEKHEVREATKAESRAIWERWQREARETGAERLPISIEPLPDNRIRATMQWSTYLMYIETNSSVLGVKFDSTNKRLFIEVSRQSGTSGVLDLIVPQELVPSPDDVKVYLDGNPAGFTLAKSGNYYSIHVEYTHSLHTLTVNLIKLPTAWYTQPLNLALITLAIVAAIGAVYWFKFRR